ncbi:helix-turn-helix domain-containing protein [Brucella grignonensis]|uniref:helix-turn-helix domain-containing protein n=1 Tax=Brucella grignonensis TaxID=94627 RepID=UPI000B99218A|nr:helix-turn-helix domain-containing protein [Brucella grignonensis]NKB84017.1 helix-turn-helix domain-containing protein [Brucella grignonensis]
MTNHIIEKTNTTQEHFGFEALLTIQQAAERLGVHVWALRRAVNSGTIPAYQPFNGRKLVRLTEVVAAINASKIGGENA